MSITALKKIARSAIGMALSTLEQQYIATASKAALQKLLLLPQVESAECLAAFASMEKEVQTDQLILTLLGMGKRVLLPRVLGRRKMAFLAVAPQLSEAHSHAIPATACSRSSKEPEKANIGQLIESSSSDLASMLGLQTSKWGIREPVFQCAAAPPADASAACQARQAAKQPVDVIIVPCVSFGTQGSRLGHGGGFYGTFMSSSIAQLHGYMRCPMV